MIPQCYIDFHKERQKQTSAFHQRLKKHCTVDDVHDVRVDIKRLRALYQLIGWMNHRFNAESQLKPVRNFFKAAGKLRDLHVQMELTRRWTSENRANLSEYYNYLVAEEQSSRPVFGRACTKFAPKEMAFGLKEIRKALSRMSVPEVIFRTEQRLVMLVREVIANSREEQLTEDNFHQIRIKTKEARYVLELLTLCREATDEDRALNDQLRSCHRALGKWHDCVVALDSLRLFLQEEPSDGYFDKSSYDRFDKSLVAMREQNLSDFRVNWVTIQQSLQAVGGRVSAF